MPDDTLHAAQLRKTATSSQTALASCHSAQPLLAMKQTRICEYLGLSCTHLRTIFDLPLKIRLSIYVLAGVPEGDFITISPPECPDDGESHLSGASSNMTINLLQTCSGVHEDVMMVLLQRNTIIIGPTDLDYGLRFLRQLSPWNCSCIRRLEVYLHMEDLSGLSSRGGLSLNPKRIDAWNDAARHILEHVDPKSIVLRLACDTSGKSDHASAIVQPLLDFPGALRVCELRLGDERDPRLSAMALEAACRATGNYSEPKLRKGAFRFFDLPHEIRSSILEYTDLVTPYRQVQWSPQTGFSCIFLLYNCGDEDCDTSLHHGCRFRFCNNWNYPDSYPQQFFCQARHSTYSHDCHCWIAPGPLMLVSRTMYHEAMAVFYSQNRIIVGRTEDPQFPDAGTPLMRLGASMFITEHTWPGVLHHLRTLELVFTPEETAHIYEKDDPAYLDWCYAAQHLAAHANLPSLDLVVHLSMAELATCLNERKLLKHKHKIAVSKGSLPPRGYTQLVVPLEGLSVLRRFFVHLEAPWYWSPGSSSEGTPFHQHPSARAVERQARIHLHGWEIQLEKAIMGDGYDSFRVGKGDEKESFWLRRMKDFWP